LAHGDSRNIGGYFSKDRPIIKCNSGGLIVGSPEIVNNRIISVDEGWVKIAQNYKAWDDYGHFTIGNFNDNTNTIGAEDQFIYIDDVSIIDLGPSDCTPNWLIENTTYSAPEPLVRASSTIAAGFDVGATSVNGDVMLKAGANIEYRAVNNIILEPGFLVAPGAVFKAYIAPCDCPSPNSNAGISNTICDNTPYQIGMVPENGNTYSWRCSATGGTNYLSSNIVSNPIFQKPPTGSGSFTYFLDVTNNCGLSSSSSVLIKYNSPPINNPSVAVSNIVYGDYVSFDLDINGQTESVDITILGAANNALRTYHLMQGINFNCCHFNWKIPEYLFSCEDYSVKIAAKNYCNGNLAQQTISWPRSKNINVSSFYNNDLYVRGGSYCRSVSGAQRFEITITNRYGETVYNGNSAVANNTQSICLWDGTCSSGDCSDGTYFVTKLNFYNCANQVIIPPYYVTVMHQARMGHKEPSSDTLTVVENIPIENIDNEIQTFPNPNNGSFKLFLPGKYPNAKVYVYGAIGNIVYQSEATNTSFSEIDISAYSKGVYYVKIISGNEFYIKKIMFQ
jgi:hypothetical protein